MPLSCIAIFMKAINAHWREGRKKGRKEWRVKKEGSNDEQEEEKKRKVVIGGRARGTRGAMPPRILKHQIWPPRFKIFFNIT